MKRILIQLLAAATASWASAQTNESLAHRWNAAVRVIDEAANPVSAATVEVWFYVKPPPARENASDVIRGLTDTNGVFTTSHSDTSIDLGFQATKAGYYPTTKGYQLGLPFDYNPVKWNPTMILMLNRIGKRIPMYAKREETKIQKENDPVGFDLMAADWVAPYGKGNITDFLFTVHRKVINEREYDAELKLTFPNKGDGIAVVPPIPDTGSALRTPRTVTANDFLPERIWHYSNTSQPQSAFGYFFRVRTALDGSGHVNNALYGKIQGDIRFYVGTISPRAGIGFTYYLNPTPNDRNVEFDPTRNLLLGGDVSAP